MEQGSICHWKLAVALAMAAALGLSSPALAADINGFLREKGHGDVAVSYTTESYDEFWMGETKVTTDAAGLGKDVKTRTEAVWLAYGVTDRLTFVANLPYVKAEGDVSAGLEQEGLQDLTFLGKYRLASFGSKAKNTFVGGLGLRTIASNYEANLPVDIGDGTSDWLFRLVYQLEYRGFYVSQQVGFDLRGGDAPDGYPLFTEVGFTWGPVTYTGFYSRLTTQGGTDIGDPGFTFPSNKEEYERGGAKVFGRINDHLGLTAAAYKTFSGRNTGDSSGFSGGIDVRF